MLHEFTITMLLNQVDEAVEELNMYGFYNTYYDQPIEQFAEENGYGFYELKDVDIKLKVILEETENPPIDTEKARNEIASILKVEKEAIRYHFIKTQEWQQPFPVIDMKNGWYIKPTHSEEKLEGRVIHFEPPRAFGSGLHGTTQDCLRFILKEDLQGKKVLDVGTGAGLLSIAAALAAAEQILAVDIEDVKEEVLYNAALNKVENQISVLQGNILFPEFEIEGLFDWIFVNIAAKEIELLLPFLDKHLAANGSLLLSGMVDWNYKETLSLYEEKGFSIDQIAHSDEWVTGLLKKK
ncbi:50S ribosomal protein L11 methyltransferase [Bacillus sp. M6-12]|uniref:50S ribosomal protein L11 methyltransferase n=1 Tax=Bacillus sp. M6-12 TaxID=2054166 RepID=UPI0015E15039|nr:50S ribosomal protein L11 methyltransferase [Bacillus sp. M6-12]